MSIATIQDPRSTRRATPRASLEVNKTSMLSPQPGRLGRAFVVSSTICFGLAILGAVVSLLAGGDLLSGISLRPILFAEVAGVLFMTLSRQVDNPASWPAPWSALRGPVVFMASGLGLAAVIAEFLTTWIAAPWMLLTAEIMALVGLGALSMIVLRTLVVLDGPRGRRRAWQGGLGALLVGIALAALGLVRGFDFAPAGNTALAVILAMHSPLLFPGLWRVTRIAPWTENQRARTVALALASWVLIVWGQAFQGMTGQAPLDVNPVAGLALVAGAAGAICALIAVFVGMKQRVDEDGFIEFPRLSRTSS